ncbi:hypothetical protein GGX14DRAFT_585300 [Mycena pura]|uniref:Fungal-type protein kinase domain-containing protein n=1 Tax=Mycena pura TaxID=153505 RepID=A0AAD6VRP6_9AGAR|nr:hypothetical protein GGX14DRAFT_585300 [Mycena pura]
MPITQLHARLAHELNAAILLDVPSSILIEHIFPDTSLPRPVEGILQALTGVRGSESLFQRKTIRKPEGSWVTFPQINADEEHRFQFATDLAQFLNTVADTMQGVYRLGGGSLPKKKRRWSSAYAPATSLPLNGAHVSKHPALVLFDSKPGDEGWNSVLSIVELFFPDDYAYFSSLHRLIHGASDAFFNQDDRRFQVGLIFAARTACVVLLDHSGIVAADFFDIDQRPDLLVRSVAGLMFSSRSTIGFDTTITNLSNGQRQIKAGNEVYDIVSRLSITPTIRGKATVCWRARRSGLDFVIKDSWNPAGSTHAEAHVLDIAKDIPGIPDLIAKETVMFNRTADSTATLRSILSQDDMPEIRVHQRMVTIPFARKISYFKSRRELISVFIDAIEAHQGLVSKNVLHADVSFNNIMIVERAETDDARPQAVRRGLLIDVDSALNLKKIGYWVGLVGTFAFMSSGILQYGKSTRQKPSDDLESFFWVLVYICIRYAGPDNTTRADYPSVMDGLQLFQLEVGHSRAYEIGKYKKHVLSAKGVLERDLFPRFSVYFRDFEPFMVELRNAFQKNGRKFTYDIMLDVLRRMCNAFVLAEDWSPAYDPVGYGLQAATHKRRREDEPSPSESRHAAKAKQ